MVTLVNLVVYECALVKVFTLKVKMEQETERQIFEASVLIQPSYKPVVLERDPTMKLSISQLIYIPTFHP